MGGVEATRLGGYNCGGMANSGGEDTSVGGGGSGYQEEGGRQPFGGVTIPVRELAGDMGRVSW